MYCNVKKDSNEVITSFFLFPAYIKDVWGKNYDESNDGLISFFVDIDSPILRVYYIFSKLHFIVVNKMYGNKNLQTFSLSNYIEYPIKIIIYLKTIIFTGISKLD